MKRETTLRAWLMAMACLVPLWLVLLASGIQFNLGFKGMMLAWIGALCLVFSFDRRPASKWPARLVAMGNGLMLASGVALCGAFLAYFAARFSPFGYADRGLYRADLALGFDWDAWYRSYQGYPAVQQAARWIYNSIIFTPTLIVIALALSGQSARMLRFIATTALALLITDLLSFLVPAANPMIMLHGTHPPYVPASGVYYEVLEMVRSGIPIEVNIHQIAGLISFPSFHAASAVLYIWAAWSLGWLRYPFLLLNLGLIMVTPLEGAHYLIDVLAGLGVAGGSIALSYRWWGEHLFAGHGAEAAPVQHAPAAPQPLPAV